MQAPGADLLLREAVPAILLAAADPANPYGAALPWPELGAEEKHRPARRAGAMVVLVDGELVLYAERGGKTLLSFSSDASVLGAAAQSLAGAVSRGGLGAMTVQRIDGAESFTDTPVTTALEAAGFAPTPRGLRLRPAVR